MDEFNCFYKWWVEFIQYLSTINLVVHMFYFFTFRLMRARARARVRTHVRVYAGNMRIPSGLSTLKNKTKNRQNTSFNVN